MVPCGAFATAVYEGSLECRDWLRVQADAFLTESDHQTDLWGLFLRLISALFSAAAGVVGSFAAGYASHLLLDGGTAASLPALA